MVDGKTPALERAALFRQLREGDMSILVSIGVLSEVRTALLFN